MTGRQTMAQEVYQRLKHDVIRLAIRPGDTLSEAEVAERLHVSRQPVREAFIHLADDGFLMIRPQRATVVRPIAVADVLNAQFIREAIEAAVVRVAAAGWTDSAARAVTALLADQERAVNDANPDRFHALDEAFHCEIASQAGHLAAWEALDRHKAQMDRVRFLTLEFGGPRAINEHRRIAAALATRDPGAAEQAMRDHLRRITIDLPDIQARHPDVFGPVSATGTAEV